jgi:hypothetical protein
MSRRDRQPRGPIALLPFAGNHTEGSSTLDDDEVVKIPRLGLSSSSSGVQDKNASLIAYVARRWHYRGAEWLIGRHGAELLWRVGAHLDLLDRQGNLPAIRNRAGYFRACVQEAAQAERAAEVAATEPKAQGRLTA